MKASVIIPAFNAEKTIEECLKALKAQSLKPFEIIVVDDGSTDNTPKIVKKIGGIRLLRQENSGPAKARNFGAENAKGNVLVFTDSDCIADRDFLREITGPFEEKNVAGVQGKYKTKQKELVARLTQLEIEQRHEKMAKQRFIDFMGSYAAAYRANVFNAMKGFDTSFPMASGEDTDLSFRISKTGKKMVFAEKAVVWHTHPSSWAKYFKVKFFRAFWRAKIYGKHKGKIVKDAYTSQLLKIQLGLIYLFPLALIVWAANQNQFWEPVVIFMAFIATTIPFAFWAIKRDKVVGTLFPFVAIFRTISFGIGLICGAVREVRDSI